MVNLPIKVILTGQDADNHELPAYDGLSSLAGLSLAATLITHYAATGRIRRRGHFDSRARVRLQSVKPGSVLFGLVIEFVASNPFILGVGGTLVGGVASSALYDLIKLIVKKNIGHSHEPQTQAVAVLSSQRGGDLEALADATEPGLRQAHAIIRNGADRMEIIGKKDQPISIFDGATKDYISQSIVDDEVIVKDVSVAAFNANSGHGRVFDHELGRTVAIYIPEHSQKAFKSVLGWGLNEYAKGTSQTISVKFSRILAWDGRPKKYIILDAEIPEN